MPVKKGKKFSAETLQRVKAKRAAHRAAFGGTKPRKRGEAKKPIDYQGAGYDMVFGFDFTIRYRSRRGGSPMLAEERFTFKDD